MSSASSQDSGDGWQGAAAPLSLRLVLIFFSTAFLLVIAASGILYMGTLSALQSADDQVVDKRAGSIQSLIGEPALNTALLLHEVNDDNQGPRQIFIRVVTSAKDAAVETEGMKDVLPAGIFPEPAIAGKEAVRATVIAAGGSYRLVSHPAKVRSANDAPAVIQVGTDTSLDQQSLGHFQKILLSVIGAALPLSALLAWLIVRRELSPLSRITAATKAIDASSIGDRLDLNRLPAELHDLGMQFNAMLSRIERAWKDLEHYADTIAHEMRTPLNRMRLSCEIALGEGRTEEELREVMVSNVGECERLTRLLNGLLFLARADTSHARLASARIAPAEQIRTVHEFFNSVAAERGIALNEDCRPVPDVIADRDLFKQALANLVSNAIAHTPRGGAVTIGGETRNGEVAIWVKDTGSGIRDEDKPRIFERFYRGTVPRQDDGLGLGLAITKGIAELHGGRIDFESKAGKGTTFTLTFRAAGPNI